MLVNFSRVPRYLVPTKYWRVTIDYTERTNILISSVKRVLSMLLNFSLAIQFGPSLHSVYHSIKIILIGATLYWQTLIISALKGNLPVFHGQGKERGKQFLRIITWFPSKKWTQFQDCPPFLLQAGTKQCFPSDILGVLEKVYVCFTFEYL
jgi:hypothetical protein